MRDEEKIIKEHLESTRIGPKKKPKERKEPIYYFKEVPAGSRRKKKPALCRQCKKVFFPRNSQQKSCSDYCRRRFQYEKTVLEPVIRGRINYLKRLEELKKNEKID